MSKSLAEHDFEQALLALEASEGTTLEKIDMLMHVAASLHKQPKSAKQILDAVDLYDRALSLCPENYAIARSRLHAGKGAALQAYPGEHTQYLLAARDEYQKALQMCDDSVHQIEAASIRMNLGLLLQTLAQADQGSLSQAISLYQDALRVFTKDSHPVEFAILHNNLATAYLALPAGDGGDQLKEALAVQSYMAALELITLEGNPNEYAMLQNNLANALQYADFGKPFENRQQALSAYDQALKVRNRRSSPLLYANTICNKANCLANLPDDIDQPEKGNKDRLQAAEKLYQEAREIFLEHDEHFKAALVDEALAQIRQQTGGVQ